MRIAPARLPRLLGVVIMAFAPYDARRWLGAAGLSRGVAVQLAYRWANRQVLADRCDRAVLMWSVVCSAGERRRPLQEVLGVLAAASVGVALVVIGNAFLLLPIGEVLRAVGVDAGVVIDVGLAVVGARLLMMAWRAFCAYRDEAALTSLLSSPSTTRWRIDCLAAAPAGRGHGGRLLDEFLSHADGHDAEIVLHCQVRNVAFYRNHGFRLVDIECPGLQRLMLRDPGSTRNRAGEGRDPKHQSRTPRPGRKAGRV